MSIKTATAGNKGKGVRSDCHVTLTLEEQGGIQVRVESKVEAMFGKDIRRQIRDFLEYYGIPHATVFLEDSGALPFVISARLEAALKQLMNDERDYLSPMLAENNYHTSKEQYRISRLYLPGNTPSLMINAGLHRPNGIILDLEDAVAPSKKWEARFLVRNALRSLNFYGIERMVRINQIPQGLDDLEYIVPHNVNLVLIPKCENAGQIKQVNQKIDEISGRLGITDPVWLMPIIESAKGVVDCYEIAKAAKNIVAMAIGLEDLTADLGTRRTMEGDETFFSRSKLVIACRAAGIQPIDSVFSDVGDSEGLKQNVMRSKAMGFDGMGCIHPRQIQILHDYYAPDEQEIEKAKKIVRAFKEAEIMGLGVVSLGTKMIDPPVVKRAQRTIDLAIGIGKISKNWMEEEQNEKV